MQCYLLHLMACLIFLDIILTVIYSCDFKETLGEKIMSSLVDLSCLSFMVVWQNEDN